MQTLYIVAGHSGLGKSTYAGQLSEKTNAIIICPDTIRKELTGDESDQSRSAFIFNVLVPKRIREALAKGQSVIFDATNLKRRDRMQISALAGPSVNKECHFFCPDVSLAMKYQKNRVRQVPRDIVEKQAQRFQIPDDTEGFDLIYNITQKHGMRGSGNQKKYAEILKETYKPQKENSYGGCCITGVA